MNEENFENPTMTVCRFCGAELPCNSSFCALCGKSVFESKSQVVLDKIQRGVSVVFMCISVILTIVIFVATVEEGKSSIILLIILSPGLGLIYGGLIPGLFHIGDVYRKIKNLLYIPILGWVLFIQLIVAVPLCGGSIFMLVDFFRFLKARKRTKKN